MAKTVPDVDLVTLPSQPRAPLNAVGRRVGFAVFLLIFIAVVVYAGRDGYDDTAGGGISMLDALYYASVTVTTTGYGDISAVTPSTRLATLLLITPARILFLILVVGTTVEVLTERSRRILLTQRWRRTVQDHHIICGFGSTGASAAAALMHQEIGAEQIVVVDTDPEAITKASEQGFTAVRGNAAQVAVLRQAAIESAKTVVVTPNRDDTAVLITLTARELNDKVNIVVAGREQENLHLLAQSGANSVIDSSAAVGRLLGLATQAPGALDLIDDLLDAGSDLELTEIRPVVGPDGEVRVPAGVRVVEVVRDGVRLTYDDARMGDLTATDRLVVVRSARSNGDV